MLRLWLVTPPCYWRHHSRISLTPLLDSDGFDFPHWISVISRSQHFDFIHPSEPPLHLDIRIAKDGCPITCRGAWIGNDLRESTPWTPVLDKVRNTLKKWNKASPSLDAKGYIVQMFAGGMTQFLTKAQSMPKEIESALVSTIRNFIWTSNAPSISLQRLYAPKGEGGINLLDIPA